MYRRYTSQERILNRWGQAPYLRDEGSLDPARASVSTKSDLGYSRSVLQDGDGVYGREDDGACCIESHRRRARALCELSIVAKSREIWKRDPSFLKSRNPNRHTLVGGRRARRRSKGTTARTWRRASSTPGVQREDRVALCVKTRLSVVSGNDSDDGDCF